MKHLLRISLLLLFAACSDHSNPNPPDPEQPSSGIAAPQNITLNIVSVYPHDPAAYTQGLEIHNGKLYEGTGDFEHSSLRISDIKTGKVEKVHMMGTPRSDNGGIFGEGITIFNNKLYQLTWQSHIVNVYDINNIDKPISTFNWPYEGWGITHTDKELIVSDGSANLYWVNPDDFKVITTKQVNDNSGPVANLNELELINGYVYANVYGEDFIIKIDPSNGHVVGKINLPGIIQQFNPGFNPSPEEVLNGIAYDSTTRKMYITGKRWPKMFETTFN